MMYLARCVREMWASKYGTLDSALKISQTPGYLPLPGHRSPKITIADVCPPSARIVFGGGGDRCLGQMSDHGLCLDMCVNG